MIREHVIRSTFKPGISSLAQHWTANKIRKFFDVTLFSIMLGFHYHNIITSTFTPTLFVILGFCLQMKKQGQILKGCSKQGIP
jgi:hypothetical protein